MNHPRNHPPRNHTQNHPRNHTRNHLPSLDLQPAFQPNIDVWLEGAMLFGSQSLPQFSPSFSAGPLVQEQRKQRKQHMEENQDNRNQQRKTLGAGEGKKNAKFWAPHPLGPPPFAPPSLSGLPKWTGQKLIGPNWPKPRWPKRDWPKSVSSDIFWALSPSPTPIFQRRPR